MKYYIRATGKNRYGGGTCKWLRITSVKDNVAYFAKDNYGVDISGPCDNLEFRKGNWPDTEPCSKDEVLATNVQFYRCSWRVTSRSPLRSSIFESSSDEAAISKASISQSLEYLDRVRPLHGGGYRLMYIVKSWVKEESVNWQENGF